MAEFDFLDNKHPIYKANTQHRAARMKIGSRLMAVLGLKGTARTSSLLPGVWLRDERRLRGGDAVLPELRRFEWETLGGEHYRARQNEATYIPFPALTAGKMVGHLMRQAPAPGNGLDFGALGQVDAGGRYQSRADLLWYNADGVGVDGSQWNNFWNGVQRRAMATGHRWVMVEAPEVPARTLADELAGARPWAVEFSPTQVPDWNLTRGTLDYVTIDVPVRRVVRSPLGGALGAQEEVEKLLLTREGFTDFGDRFAGGGWWRFSADRKRILGNGTWEKTGGQVPFFPFYAARENVVDPDFPAMSRGLLTELGNVAVSYMNLASAADFDAFEAAASIQWLMNVDKEAFNLAMQMIEDGNRFVPLQRSPADLSAGGPSVHDGSTGAVAGAVFETRLNAKLREAERLGAVGASSTEDASGESKKAGFAETLGAILSDLASEREAAENIALHFFERRFGITEPTAKTKWPREFDLLDLEDDAVKFFELEQMAGIQSETVGAGLMAAVVRAKGFVDEAKMKAVEAEYRDSARTRTRERALMAQGTPQGPEEDLDVV